MINDYQITSGINKNNKESLKELSLYLQNVESTNPFACQQLNEIIENKMLTGEPVKVAEE